MGSFEIPIANSICPARGLFTSQGQDKDYAFHYLSAVEGKISLFRVRLKLYQIGGVLFLFLIFCKRTTYVFVLHELDVYCNIFLRIKKFRHFLASR